MIGFKIIPKAENLESHEGYQDPYLDLRKPTNKLQWAGWNRVGYPNDHLRIIHREDTHLKSQGSVGSIPLMLIIIQYWVFTNGEHSFWIEANQARRYCKL